MSGRYELQSVLDVAVPIAGTDNLPATWWCAVDKMENNNHVAIKIIEKGTTDGFNRQAKKLQREYEIHSALIHKHIVRLVMRDENFTHYFFVTEFVDVRGDTLGEYLRRWGRMSETESAWILCQILTALKYMHGKMIIHRDISPSNIYFDKKREDTAGAESFFHVKLGHFTEARSYSETSAGGLRNSNSSTSSGYAQSTGLSHPRSDHSYCSPEILTDAPLFGPPADMWALGVVAYLMLSGKLPFEGPDQGVLVHTIKTEKPSFLASSGQPLSAECKDFIARLLMSDASHRMRASDACNHEFIATRCSLEMRTVEGEEDPVIVINNLTHQKSSWKNLKHLKNALDRFHARPKFDARDPDAKEQLLEQIGELSEFLRETNPTKIQRDAFASYGEELQAMAKQLRDPPRDRTEREITALSSDEGYPATMKEQREAKGASEASSLHLRDARTSLHSHGEKERVSQAFVASGGEPSSPVIPTLKIPHLGQVYVRLNEIVEELEKHSGRKSPRERVSFSSKIVDGFKTTFKPNKQAGEAGLGKSHASVSTGEGDEMAGHHRTDPNRATREIGSIKLLMGGRWEPYKAELSNFTLALTKDNAKHEKDIIYAHLAVYDRIDSKRKTIYSSLDHEIREIVFDANSTEDLEAMKIILAEEMEKVKEIDLPIPGHLFVEEAKKGLTKYECYFCEKSIKKDETVACLGCDIHVHKCCRIQCGLLNSCFALKKHIVSDVERRHEEWVAEKARVKERPVTEDSISDKMKSSGSSRKDVNSGGDDGLTHTPSGKRLPSSSSFSLSSQSSQSSASHPDRFQEFLQEKFAHLARDFASREVISLDRVKLFELYVKLADQYYPPAVKFFDSETGKRSKGKWMDKVFIEMQPSMLYSYDCLKDLIGVDRRHPFFPPSIKFSILGYLTEKIRDVAFSKDERLIAINILLAFLLTEHNLRQFKTNGCMASLLPVLLHAETPVEIAIGVMDILVLALKTDAQMRDQMIVPLMDFTNKIVDQLRELMRVKVDNRLKELSRDYVLILHKSRIVVPCATLVWQAYKEEKWKPRIHEKWLGILIAAAEFSHTMDFAHNYPAMRFRIHAEINPALVIEDEHNIGGPLAPVHLCEYQGRTIVSKRYPFRPATYNHMSEFIKEVTLLALCEHRNCSKMIGAYHTTYLDANIIPQTPYIAALKPTDPLFFMEYYERESINRMLYNQAGETNDRRRQMKARMKDLTVSVTAPESFRGWLDKHVDNIVRAPEMDCSLIVNMGVQVCSALAFIHSLDIIHRDIKTDNILCDKFYNFAICDFGVSRALGLSKDISFSGTLPYRPPELSNYLDRGEGSTTQWKKIDIYSLAVVFWELLHNPGKPEKTFSGISMEERAMGVREPFNDHVNHEFKALIEQMWDTDTNNRPSAMETLNSLWAIEDPAYSNKEKFPLYKDHVVTYTRKHELLKIEVWNLIASYNGHAIPAISLTCQHYYHRFADQRDELLRKFNEAKKPKRKSDISTRLHNMFTSDPSLISPRMRDHISQSAAGANQAKYKSEKGGRQRSAAHSHINTNTHAVANSGSPGATGGAGSGTVKAKFASATDSSVPYRVGHAVPSLSISKEYAIPEIYEPPSNKHHHHDDLEHAPQARDSIVTLTDFGILESPRLDTSMMFHKSPSSGGIAGRSGHASSGSGSVSLQHSGAVNHQGTSSNNSKRSSSENVVSSSHAITLNLSIASSKRSSSEKESHHSGRAHSHSPSSHHHSHHHESTSQPQTPRSHQHYHAQHANATHVTPPSSLHHSQNDLMLVKEDMERLRSRLVARLQSKEMRDMMSETMELLAELLVCDDAMTMQQQQQSSASNSASNSTPLSPQVTPNNSTNFPSQSPFEEKSPIEAKEKADSSKKNPLPAEDVDQFRKSLSTFRESLARANHANLQSLVVNQPAIEGSTSLSHRAETTLNQPSTNSSSSSGNKVQFLNLSSLVALQVSSGAITPGEKSPSSASGGGGLTSSSSSLPMSNSAAIPSTNSPRGPNSHTPLSMANASSSSPHLPQLTPRDQRPPSGSKLIMSPLHINLSLRSSPPRSSPRSHGPSPRNSPRASLDHIPSFKELSQGMVVSGSSVNLTSSSSPRPSTKISQLLDQQQGARESNNSNNGAAGTGSIEEITLRRSHSPNQPLHSPPHSPTHSLPSSPRASQPSPTMGHQPREPVSVSSPVTPIKEASKRDSSPLNNLSRSRENLTLSNILTKLNSSSKSSATVQSPPTSPHSPTGTFNSNAGSGGKEKSFRSSHSSSSIHQKKDEAGRERDSAPTSPSVKESHAHHTHSLPTSIQLSTSKERPASMSGDSRHPAPGLHEKPVFAREPSGGSKAEERAREDKERLEREKELNSKSSSHTEKRSPPLPISASTHASTDRLVPSKEKSEGSSSHSPSTPTTNSTIAMLMRDSRREERDRTDKPEKDKDKADKGDRVSFEKSMSTSSRAMKRLIGKDFAMKKKRPAGDSSTGSHAAASESTKKLVANSASSSYGSLPHATTHTLPGMEERPEESQGERRLRSFSDSINENFKDSRGESSPLTERPRSQSGHSKIVKEEASSPEGRAYHSNPYHSRKEKEARRSLDEKTLGAELTATLDGILETVDGLKQSSPRDHSKSSKHAKTNPVQHHQRYDSLPLTNRERTSKSPDAHVLTEHEESHPGNNKLRRSTSAFAILTNVMESDLTPSHSNSNEFALPMLSSSASYQYHSSLASQSSPHALDSSPGTSSTGSGLPSPHGVSSTSFNSQTSKHHAAQASPMKFPPSPKKKSKGRPATEEPDETHATSSSHPSSTSKPLYDSANRPKSSREKETSELLQFNDAITTKLTEKYSKKPQPEEKSERSEAKGLKPDNSPGTLSRSQPNFNTVATHPNHSNHHPHSVNSSAHGNVVNVTNDPPPNGRHNSPTNANTNTNSHRSSMKPLFRSTPDALLYKGLDPHEKVKKDELNPGQLPNIVVGNTSRLICSNVYLWKVFLRHEDPSSTLDGAIRNVTFVLDELFFSNPSVSQPYPSHTNSMTGSNPATREQQQSILVPCEPFVLERVTYRAPIVINIHVLTERYNPVTIQYHVQFEAQPKVSLININKKVPSNINSNATASSSTHH